MTTKHVEIIAMSILIAMVFYTIVAIATIGRFAQTHAVVVKSDCVSCHIDSFQALNNSKHISDMREGQSYVIDNFILMRNSNDTESDLQGLCYSCHNVNKRSGAFAFQDFYIDKENNTVINGLTFWTNETPVGNENESVRVKITVESVTPPNASLGLDTTIQLMNFSGQQNYSKLSTNVLTSLSINESTEIVRDNIFADYFRVYLSAGGDWESATIVVTVGEPSLTYPILSIDLNGGGLNHYVLPNDFNLQYYSRLYFHTSGNYSITRVTDAKETIRNIELSNNSLLQSYELMRDPQNNTGFTCGSPDAMCHINQKITDIGMKYGIDGERFYNHEMEVSTSNICDNCHI